MGSGLATYYKVETRSKEFHSTDRYRFGGKELDTRGGLFHYDFGARHYDPVLPMFNGYDPMAEDNIHVSPLAYCHGNPVMFIDPTGKREWFVNQRGYIVGQTNRHPNKDIIVVVDKKGKLTYGDNGAKVIAFKGGTITGTENVDLIANGSMDSFMVHGDDNAKKLFEFFAEPADGKVVEWSWLAIGEQKDQKNIVGTSHKKDSTGVGVHYSKNNKVRKRVHNHPNGTGPSGEDRDLAKELKDEQPTVEQYVYSNGKYIPIRPTEDKKAH